MDEEPAHIQQARAMLRHLMDIPDDPDSPEQPETQIPMGELPPLYVSATRAEIDLWSTIKPESPEPVRELSFEMEDFQQPSGLELLAPFGYLGAGKWQDDEVPNADAEKHVDEEQVSAEETSEDGGERPRRRGRTPSSSHSADLAAAPPTAQDERLHAEVPWQSSPFNPDAHSLQSVRQLSPIFYKPSRSPSAAPPIPSRQPKRKASAMTADTSRTSSASRYGSVDSSMQMQQRAAIDAEFKLVKKQRRVLIQLGLSLGDAIGLW
jgi:hypothetical protein